MTVPTTTQFKDVLDLPEWRPVAVTPNAFAVGMALCSDMRGTNDRDPYLYQFTASTVVNAYHIMNDGWQVVGSPAMSGTFGIAACAVVAPARGPRGVIASGTTTSVVLTTALPAIVGVNTLASRGDGQGYKIRIIGNGGVGSSGLTEERYIIANTTSTTPTITLDEPLSFTPAAGDAYEILSGRVYFLNPGSAVAGQWKYYDIATGFFSGNLVVTNLVAATTESILVAFDEQYVPCDNVNGEGYITGSGDGGVASRALTATASAAGTLTGQATGGDATVLLNEWRNFQIRVVKDATAPTAVGQRRRITSHTAGPSPVYTVTGNWTVTPSADAQYVIENNNEIIMLGGNTGNVYCYAQDTYGTAQTGDTWSITTYSARGATTATGQMAFLPFGVSTSVYASDTSKNFRYSQVFSWRGNSMTLDVLDIAGGANGLWTLAAPYGLVSTTISAGTCGDYDGVSSIGLGRYFYFCIASNSSLIYRFNAFTRQTSSWNNLRFAQSSNVGGKRMAVSAYFDGDTKLSFVYLGRSSGTEMFHILAQR